MLLTLLGSPEVVLDDGSRSPLPPGRPARLLTALALEPGRVIDRDGLVEAVWDSSPPTSLRNALHVYVSRLRSLLGSAAILTTGNGYRLALPESDIDVLRFQQLTADATSAAQRHDWSRATALYGEAIALHRAPLLAGESLSAVLAEARRRLCDLHDYARDGLLTVSLRDANPAEAAALIPVARELVAEAPLREGRHLLLMEALNISGRPGEALAAYEGAATLLRETLGVGPSEAMRRLRDQILLPGGGLGEEASDLLDAPLIGRDRQVEALTALVRERSLVTVTGPGGVGKSRLAAEVLSRLGPTFGGLQHAVDLADVEPGTDPAAAVGRFLDLPSDNLDDLVAAFGDAPRLLLLDTCDRLDVAAFARRLTDRLPRLRILATSRHPLGSAGEVVMALEGLDAGTADDPTDPTELPGVSLYLLRAAEAGHAVHPGRVPDAAALVRLLHGLPLAIELVAAHPDGGRPDLLLERPLADLALTRRVGTSARHETLRACIEWSIDSLSPAARTVLDVLCEPASPLPDSLAVAASGVIIDDPSAALDELIASAVALRPNHPAPSVTVLPWTREAVVSRRNATERSDVRRRLLQALAEHADTLLERPLAVPRTPEASARVQAMHQVAMEVQRWDDTWPSATGRALALLLLVDAPLERAELAELSALLGQAAASLDPLDVNVTFDVLRARLGVALASSDDAAVEAISFELRALRPQVDPIRQSCWSVDEVFLALERGEFETATRLSSHAIELIMPQPMGPLSVRAGRARMHAVRLHAGLRQGVSEALQTAALAEMIDSTESISALGEAAEILVSGGELDLAASYSRRAARQALRWNSPHSLVYVLSLADVALEEGRLNESRAIVLALLERVWRRADHRYQKWCLIRLAQISARSDDPKRASTLLGASSTISTRQGWDSDPDVCDLLESLPAVLGGETFRDAFDRGASAPRGWVSAILDEPAPLPATLHPELLGVLRAAAGPVSAPRGPIA